MMNSMSNLKLHGAGIGARLGGLAVLAFLVLTTGCNEHRDRIISVDAIPFNVEGVYSVTGDQQVTIHWRANQETDIAYYKVYRNTAPTGTFTVSLMLPVPDAVQLPPPVAMHVHAALVMAAGKVSVTVAPMASLVPAFDTAIV